MTREQLEERIAKAEAKVEKKLGTIEKHKKAIGKYQKEIDSIKNGTEKSVLMNATMMKGRLVSLNLIFTIRKMILSGTRARLKKLAKPLKSTRISYRA